MYTCRNIKGLFASKKTWKKECGKERRGEKKARGGALYFGVDIIHLKGLSKHTLSTYFPGMKIDPNYAFLHAFSLICPSCPFQNWWNWQKHTLFSNFAWFCAPKQCMHVHRLVQKTTLTLNYVIFFFFLRGWYPTSIQVPPPWEKMCFE